MFSAARASWERSSSACGGNEGEEEDGVVGDTKWTSKLQLSCPQGLTFCLLSLLCYSMDGMCVSVGVQGSMKLALSGNGLCVNVSVYKHIHIFIAQKKTTNIFTSFLKWLP